MISFLVYGMILLVLIQPDHNRKIAAGVISSGCILTDLLFQTGLIGGHWYYLFASVMCVVITISLTASKAHRLVSRLHYACVFAFALNATDWVLYANTGIISDIVYELSFIALYLYIWITLIGRHGANVVGRYDGLRVRQWRVNTSSRAFSHNTHHHKAQK